MSRAPADAKRLAGILEASPCPSLLLDAGLMQWAGIKAAYSPTASVEAADRFIQEATAGATWTLLGGVAESTATITAIGEFPCSYSARGATPALALLAALMRGHEQQQ